MSKIVQQISFYCRGINYNNVLSNLLWVYNDPANLVLVINSSDHEEKYFTEKFNLATLPTIGSERYNIENNTLFVYLRDHSFFCYLFLTLQRKSISGRRYTLCFYSHPRSGLIKRSRTNF